MSSNFSVQAPSSICKSVDCVAAASERGHVLFEPPPQSTVSSPPHPPSATDAISQFYAAVFRDNSVYERGRRLSLQDERAPRSR